MSTGTGPTVYIRKFEGVSSSDHLHLIIEVIDRTADPKVCLCDPVRLQAPNCLLLAQNMRQIFSGSRTALADLGDCIAQWLFMTDPKGPSSNPARAGLNSVGQYLLEQSSA